MCPKFRSFLRNICSLQFFSYELYWSYVFVEDYMNFRNPYCIGFHIRSKIVKQFSTQINDNFFFLLKMFFKFDSIVEPFLQQSRRIELSLFVLSVNNVNARNSSKHASLQNPVFFSFHV